MRNKIVKFAFLTVLVSAMLLTACACGKEQDVTVTINTPVPENQTTLPPVTDAPETDSPVPQTDNPEPSANPGQNTEAPVTKVPELDYSIFDNCAFIGNSTLHGLYQFGIITHGDFFTKVGLNVLSVYEKTTDTGTVPIIDELNNGSYEAVILLFGQNELGWPSMDSFINKYSQLLTDVWARQPDAEIFIMGMPPVSKKVSDTSDRGVTNDNINKLNAKLEQLAADRNCNFLPAPDSLKDSTGALPADASSDGIHLNMKYSRLWADHICRYVTIGLSD